MKADKKYKEKEGQRKGRTMDFFFAVLDLFIKSLVWMLEGLVKLVGALLEGLFGNDKAPSRPRSPASKAPVVVIRTDRPVSAGHVTRNPDGSGT